MRLKLHGQNIAMVFWQEMDAEGSVLLQEFIREGVGVHAFNGNFSPACLGR